MRLPLRLSVEEPLTVGAVIESVELIIVEVLDEVKEAVVAVPVRVEERLVASVIESVTLCIISLRDELDEIERDSTETDIDIVAGLSDVVRETVSENDPLVSSKRFWF